MEFPVWAPAYLVKHYYSEIEKQKSGEISNLVADADLLIFRYDFQFISRPNNFLPLLKKALTDERMRNVWISLKRRSNKDSFYRNFWRESLIALVRGVTSTESKKERKSKLTKISKASEKLAHLLLNTPEFDSFDTLELMNRKYLDISLNREDINKCSKDCTILQREKPYEVFLLKTIPYHLVVLFEISRKAKELSTQDPMILHSNSENARVHYFIRYISNFLFENFGQHLYKTVADFTTVIFNQEVDADLVRRLVKPQKR